MLQLVRNATVFAPEPLGAVSILIAGDRVAWIGRDANEADAIARSLGPVGLLEEIDLAGRRVIPGLIDAHVHLTGGGGEAGAHTKVPPLTLSQFSRGGTTTVVALLGTDDLTRGTGELLAAVYGLRNEGLSAYCYTGGYHLPLRTLTGSARGDIVYLDPVLGVGELAISDHRSSQPTLDELLRVASEAHVAGLMTGKAGTVHLHMGDGVRGLELVRAALDQSEIPARVFHPTHVNRNRRLFQEACALTSRGVTIDVTAFPVEEGEDAYAAPEALRTYLDRGLPAERITISSDGGGCLPTFDSEGQVAHFDVGRPAALGEALADCLHRGIALEAALPAFTSNVARVLRLARKGRLAAGADADLAVLDAHGTIESVMARGVWQVREHRLLRRGAFERDATSSDDQPTIPATTKSD
ncbi:MAG: beta-aspartyl-peptidase [Candidatus Eisenbacteria bacterium]|nr:beta-aspartyl-peptidase [Candidatus Eisenbacteria bacterium]MCC7141870.1 beta-aspartyl-peptidase [Candidatus Eisenbacteria bacterium]